MDRMNFAEFFQKTSPKHAAGELGLSLSMVYKMGGAAGGEKRRGQSAGPCGQTGEVQRG